MKKNDFFVVIPAYNESNHIGGVINTVQKYATNIVVVDDGSKDNTYDIAKKSGVSVLKHVINMGKGATLKTGCDFAFLNGAKYIVVLDADAQHDPKHIPDFLNALETNDIVFGYRTGRNKMPSILRFGNWFINKSIYMMFGMNLRDTQSGYRAFSAKAYQKIKWDAMDYSMESEMIANAGKHKLRYKEIPIATIYSNNYKGTTVLDGMTIVLKLIWWRFVKCF